MSVKNVTFAVLALAFNFVSAQTKQLESLIQNIDNKDTYIVMARTMSSRVHNESANQIVQIGKTATPELIKVLNSQNKGIAAHFILSEIWKEQWTAEICCMIRTEGTIEIVNINGLEIKIEDDVLS